MGRLRWNKDLRTIKQFFSELGLSANEAKDFLGVFKHTFDERAQYWKHLGLSGEVENTFSPEVARIALKNISNGASIFSVQQLADLLSIESPEIFSERVINVPGTTDNNWTFAFQEQYSLERLLANERLIESLSMIHASSGRV